MVWPSILTVIPSILKVMNDVHFAPEALTNKPASCLLRRLGVSAPLDLFSCTRLFLNDHSFLYRELTRKRPSVPTHLDAGLMLL